MGTGSAVPSPPPPSEATPGDRACGGRGAGGARGRGRKSGRRQDYLYARLQDKGAGRPTPAPACAVDFIFPAPRGRAGRCGGGSRLPGGGLAKGPAADVGAPAPVRERQRQPGDCLATRLQTSSPPVGRGGCPGSGSGLKENSPSSRQPGRVVPEHTCTRCPARGDTRAGTRPGTGSGTRARAPAPRRALPVSSCAGPKLRPRGAPAEMDRLPGHQARAARCPGAPGRRGGEEGCPAPPGVVRP